MNEFFLFDTNSLVSASLIGGTTLSRAMDRAVMLGKLAFSNATMDELVEVLFRKKFDKYFLNDEEKWSAIQHIALNAVFFSITGDKDLLILHPFRGIPILNAADFLNNF